MYIKRTITPRGQYRPRTIAEQPDHIIGLSYNDHAIRLRAAGNDHERYEVTLSADDAKRIARAAQHLGWLD